MIKCKKKYLLCGLVVSVSIAIMISVFLAGCNTISSSGPGASGTIVETVREQIEQTDEIESASSKIAEHLDKIDSSASLILLEASDMDRVLVSGIQAAAQDIRDTTTEAQKEHIRTEEALEDLSSANSRVLSAVAAITSMEETILEYEKTDQEHREEALKSMRTFLSLAFSLGFLMLVGGAFVALKIDGRLGSSIVAVGLFSIGFASASQYYFEEIAKIGLVVFIAGFVGVAFLIARNMLRGKHATLVVREVVELIEEIKDYMSKKDLNDMRKEIFGATGFANQFTSDTAKKVIAEIKAKNNFEKLSRKNETPTNINKE